MLYSSSESTLEQVSTAQTIRLAPTNSEHPGVILSTAFCHLLEDAFKSLDKPPVKEHYGKIGKWTGLIMSASLFASFTSADIYVASRHS